MKTATSNLILIILFLIIVGFLYNRYESKLLREEGDGDLGNTTIQKYLLDSNKPIMWIHVPYEYNARRWLSFGSRSSFQLNQPYLYLTAKSIITHCDDSFTICIIDDASFAKLIPGWSIDMQRVSDPISANIRTLALMRLLYIYGGMICPLSFVCLKDMVGLYRKGTMGGGMFACEMVDRNITSTTHDFYPNILFSGASKGCTVVRELCEFIRRTISNDYTAESVFLGEFNRWCMRRCTIIDGVEIGTKTAENKPILIDNLLGNQYLDLYPGTYGVYIPADEVLRRHRYEWFARMSPKQVLESNTIVGNYLLLSVVPGGAVLESFETTVNRDVENRYVGYWKTPLYPGLYGLKPNFLGDNLIKQTHTGQ